MRAARTDDLVMAIQRPLAVVAVWLVATAPATAQPVSTDAPPERAELNLPEPRELGDQRPVVGAYYYPWYGVNDRPLDHDWHNLMRVKLVPPHQPRAGFYRSDDSKTIAEHIAQSRLATLDFWAVSWWGPGTATDRT